MTRRRNGKGTLRALSHVDARGQARMVDVSAKAVTTRVAVARGAVTMRPATLKLITAGRISKGEVLAVARLAGIMAAKRTGEWIPLCHPLPLEAVNVDFTVRGRNRIDVEARTTITAKTGVEMEALVAVSAAALTIYDMCKAVDRDMTIGPIRLVEKSGGRSGTYRRKA